MDKLKLLAAVLIVVIGVVGFYYLDGEPTIVRVAALLAAAVAAVAVAYTTAQGKAGWEFVKEARVELRKVVWPTRKETMQMTLVVVVLVIVVALFLWVIDWGLIKAMKALTGQRS